MHISIGAENLFNIGGFQITNTMLTSWAVVIFLVIVSFVINRGMKKRPNGKLSLAVEGILNGFIDFMSSFAGDKKTARKFMPIVATLFFYVLTSNWAGTLPGIETIGINRPVDVVETNIEPIVDDSKSISGLENHEEKIENTTHSDNTKEEHGEFLPLFRTVNSDLNMTLLFAIVIVLGSHIVGFSTIGAKHHVGKFIVNPLKNPIGFFVGILEIIGEFSRIISLAFRLFGNIFAGSVLMLIISFLAPYIIPIPFLGLELFVGFIQALVIAVLAVMFLSSATHKHESH